MFVLIDVSKNTDGYCSFGDTIEEAIAAWVSFNDNTPNVLDKNEVMIVEGVHKIPKVTYVNAPVKPAAKVAKNK